MIVRSLCWTASGRKDPDILCTAMPLGRIQSMSFLLFDTLSPVEHVRYLKYTRREQNEAVEVWVNQTTVDTVAVWMRLGSCCESREA